MHRRQHADKVQMIFSYGKANKNLHEAVRLYNAEHPQRQVCRRYMRDLVRKFETTFSVKDAPRSGKPQSLNDEQKLDVLVDQIENPSQSVRQTGEKHGISKDTVQRLLKKHKFHPYKIKLVQELNEDDYDRRLEFCEEMETMINGEADLLDRICFSDESTFFLNGLVNRHNCRYWSTENPHEFREAHTQYPQKLNVWCGIMGDSIIGPYFIPGNLNGEMYLDLLQDVVVPAIEEIAANNDDIEPIFQQDGAPPHFALIVRNYLDAAFPGSWIGRRGAIEWPPRSPDMNPLDYFLWGHLKSKVYKTQPTDIEDLRQRIIEECAKITPTMLRNVREAFTDRLLICQAQFGAQFEHLLD